MVKFEKRHANFLAKFIKILDLVLLFSPLCFDFSSFFLRRRCRSGFWNGLFEAWFRYAWKYRGRADRTFTTTNCSPFTVKMRSAYPYFFQLFQRSTFIWHRAEPSVPFSIVSVLTWKLDHFRVRFAGIIPSATENITATRHFQRNSYSTWTRTLHHQLQLAILTNHRRWYSKTNHFLTTHLMHFQKCDLNSQ